jgi:uncharacterized protein YndB with AHSA1/START domain
MNSNGKFILILEKEISSNPEDAFEAFTNPNKLSIWFTTSARAELRVGGKYVNADGDHGEYLTLDPPQRVAFTWENDKHCPGTVVTVTIDRNNSKSVTLRLEHSGLESEADYEDMKGGWSWALDSLKSFLETGKPISHEVWLRQRRAEE